VWSLVAGFAHAQDTAAPQSQPSAAAMVATPVPQDDFARGLSALQAGQNRDAVSAFKAAYDQSQNPSALLNLGIAYTNLEQPHAAVQALQSYIEHADPVHDAEQISAVRAEIERVRASSGRIGVKLIPAHAAIEIDGEPVTPRDGELLVAPGKRHVTAHADGYVPFDHELDVQAGQFNLEIELQRVDTSVATVASAAPTLEQPAEAQKPAAPPSEVADEGEEFAANGCLLKSVCMGPVVSLLGPPNLIGGGLHARIGRYLGVGVDYQVLPTLNFNPVSLGSSLFSANARVYPFGGAFFLGGGIGYQSIRGQFRQDDIGVQAHVGFPAAMASIGFMGHDGFVLGADLGMLFPLTTMHASVTQAPGTNLAAMGVAQADIDAARSKAESQVNKTLGSLPFLLQVNLIRLGYMF
jgi:hypothetical protein